MKLSLRARGALDIIHENPSQYITHTSLSEFVTDTEKYIDNTLHELVTAGILEVNNGRFSLVQKKPDDNSLEARIYKYYPDNRVYSLIAWFLDKSVIDYTSDRSLRDRVETEQVAAKVIQFWTDNEIFSAYDEVISKHVDKQISMQYVLDCLVARSSGGVVI
jgi:hypothetical protein